MRVLHCPTNTGGHPSGLARAERRLGLESTSLSYFAAPYVQDPDLCLDFGRSGLLNELKRRRFFRQNWRRYDVFHFNFGLSFFYYPTWLGFLDFWDLPRLKKAGKKIVVTYQGCDARQRDYCVEHFGTCACAREDCYGGRCDRSSDRRKRRRIEKLLAHADHVWALNPDLLGVLPGAEFMPYASVDPEEWRPAPAQAGGKLRVLHAPSDRIVKGSDHVAEAMARITSERPDAEYVEVTGRPHGEMRALCASADLVVDQLLVGWYGALAVEAMALAKPVICYIREDDLKFIPPEMRAELPVIRAEPGDLYDVLQAALADRDELARIGRRSRAFVEKWHDPAKLARRTREVYESAGRPATGLTPPAS